MPDSRNRPRPTSRQRSWLAQRLVQRKRRMHPGVAQPIVRNTRWWANERLQPCVTFGSTPRNKRKGRQRWVNRAPIQDSPFAK